MKTCGIPLTRQQHGHLAGVDDEQHRTVQVHIVAQHSGRIGTHIYVNQAKDHRDENVRHYSGED